MAILAPVREAADSLAKASTPEPFSTSRTSNWIARLGGLPPYIQHIAHDLMEKRRKTESEAIEMAVGIVENPPRNWGADARAAAAKAAAQWRAMKAKNAAKGAVKAVQHSAGGASIADELALREMALVRIALLERQLGIDGLVGLLERAAAESVLQEAAAATFSPTLKRTASASGEMERHEVHDGGQHVGTLCVRSGMGMGSNSAPRWEARTINGERISDYGNTSKQKALDAVRKHLEEAPARVGKHSSGKFLVARPSSYSGQDTYTAFPSQAAARFAAGLPEQPTGPEKASQVQQLAEMLRMDLTTVSGVDIPPLRRVQEARRRDPFELAEAFDPGEARGFGGKWIAGGGHRHLSPLMVPGRSTRTNRPKSITQRRYEGGVRAHVSPATRQRLFGAFTKKESSERNALQPKSKLDDLYAMGPAHQKQFEAMMGRVQKALGARRQSTSDETAFKRAQADVSSHTDRTHVVIAALKSRKRAMEKVRDKYNGKAERLTDLVRGTVLVPHVDDLPKAIEEVRKALPAGWSIVKPENRYAHRVDDLTHRGQLSSGYRDVAVLLRSPSGFHVELQINTTHMWVAKEVHGGHVAYEERRSIVEKAKGKPKGAAAERVRQLDTSTRELYGRALARSLRGRATLR